MKFTVDNVITDKYLEGFKAFQLWTVAVSADGFQAGFSERFLALLDTGARYTSISSNRMKEILPKIRDKQGNPLQPIGSVKSQGVYGDPLESPIYVIPRLCIGKISLTDVVVIVPETKNFDCLIGRSILHQCVATYDPETDKMQFDFKDSLRQNKQTIQGMATFGDVQLFAEFSE